MKIPLPGPYLLTRAMFVQEVTRQVYPTKEDLAEDVVRILRDEMRELMTQGADFIQLDEPVLTEIVFTQGQTRTFMCAALAASKDPAADLELPRRPPTKDIFLPQFTKGILFQPGRQPLRV